MAGTMPVLAEIPGQQELHTRDHGTVKVAGLSFSDGGFHIVKCPNGAYMHSNGLPVTDIEQLRAAIPQPFLEEAENWFERRHEQEENPPQPIGFHPHGYPIFADGAIPDFSDLYAYFAPGPILTAAIVALQQYIDRTPGFVAQKLKVAPEPAQAAPPVCIIGLDRPSEVEILMTRLAAAEKATADEKALRLAAEKAAKAKKSTHKAPGKSTKKAAPATQEG